MEEVIEHVSTALTSSLVLSVDCDELEIKETKVAIDKEIVSDTEMKISKLAQ